MEERKEALLGVFEKVENLTKTSVELYKLKLIDKSSELLSGLFVNLIIFLTMLFFIAFINIALAFLIGNWIGNYGLGFLIISSFYVILAGLLYAFRKTISERVIENKLLSIFLSKNKENEKEQSKN